MRVKEARVSQKGQITVPKEVRKLLGVEPGEKVAFYIENNKDVKLTSAENIDIKSRNKNKELKIKKDGE